MARWGRGFSLVELLLVIAILALLLAILMPVLFSSKCQINAVKCASNLAQLGKAFHLYVSDWDGAYPAPGGKTGNYNYWSQSGSGGLVKYVGSRGGVGTVWCCPELKSWSGKYAARTYSMNSYLRYPPDHDYPGCLSILRGCEECIIESPRRTILLYEGIPVTPQWAYTDDYIYRCGNWTCVRGWYWEKSPYVHTVNSWLPWHGRKSNYLYCDGHVASRTPAKKPPNRPDPPLDVKMEWWIQKSLMAAKYWH